MRFDAGSLNLRRVALAWIAPGALYIDHSLWGGAKAGDLPIQWPARYEFVVNLRSARAMGFTMPHALLQRADKIIQ